MYHVVKAIKNVDLFLRIFFFCEWMHDAILLIFFYESISLKQEMTRVEEFGLFVRDLETYVVVRKK